MDAIGLEKSRDSWAVVHVKASPLALKIVAAFTLPHGLGGLADYIRSKSLKDFRVGVVVPRERSFARALELPAPSAEALEGIMRFEAEKHLPQATEEVRWGFAVTGRRGNIFSVLLGGAESGEVTGVLEEAASFGLSPGFVGVSQGAARSAFINLGLIKEGRAVAIVNLADGYTALETYSGTTPVYSRLMKAGDGLGSAVERELRLAVAALGAKGGAGYDECVVTGNGADGIIPGLSSIPGVGKVRKWEAQKEASGLSPAALGAALAALGKAKGAVSLSGPEAREGDSSYMFTAVASVCAACLLLAAGFSYIARDWYEMARLASSINSLKGQNEKAQKTIKALDRITGRIATLEEIDGKTGIGPLAALGEVTAVLPDAARLTGFEISGNTVFVEGMAESASALMLKLDKSSMLTGAELTGPVIKSEGKERFRIKLSLKQGGGGNRK